MLRWDKRGFTLPELLVTIVIMGLLFAIATSSWQGVIHRRQVDSATNQMVSDLRLVLTVMFALYSIFDISLRVFSFGNDKVEAVESARIGMERMKREIRAAKKHLATVDARPQNYNDEPTDGDSEWSEITAAAGGTGDGEKRIDFDGDSQIDTFVKIKYLIPSANEIEATQPNNAPEVFPAGAVDGPDDGTDPDYPNSANFFRVTVRGEAGNAARQVQSIYRSQNFDIPVAFFATRDINFNGNATAVDGVSLFA